LWTGCLSDGEGMGGRVWRVGAKSGDPMLRQLFGWRSDDVGNVWLPRMHLVTRQFELHVGLRGER
jgi:hypothetical protein